MSRVAKKITLSDCQRTKLQAISRASTSEQRLALRARIVLACAEPTSLEDITKKLKVSAPTVIKWRDRFVSQGFDGILDAPRSGRKPLYGESDEKRILEKLNESPPNGLSRWDGTVLARELDLPAEYIWRVMRKHNIMLARLRTWCVSTDPEFSAKSADIIGLYLNPPENALVISVDEKPQIQALSRSTGYVFSNKKTIRAIKSTYERNGTANLFAALNVATGTIFAKPTETKKRSDFIGFMNELINEIDITDGKEIHVILDNYCIHKNCDVWLANHPYVFFHYTPTSASWLNQIEVWFNILSRKVLRGASFENIEKLIGAIEKFITLYNKEYAHPFKWRKREVNGSQIRDTIENLAN